LNLASGRAYCSLTSCWTDASSRELKYDIEELSNLDQGKVLTQINQTRVYRYKFKEDEHQGRKYLGVISEESPHWITTVDKKGISASAFANFLMIGIKAQQRQLDAQQGVISALKKNVAEQQKSNAEQKKRIARLEQEQKRTAQLSQRLASVEQKLALLERNSTRRHASNDTPLAAGAVTASGDGTRGSGVSGLTLTLPTWYPHALTLTLALLAAVMLLAAIFVSYPDTGDQSGPRGMAISRNSRRTRRSFVSKETPRSMAKETNSQSYAEQPDRTARPRISAEFTSYSPPRIKSSAISMVRMAKFSEM